MSIHLLRRLRRVFSLRRSLTADIGGNVAITFGLVLIPLVALAGAAVDYSNAVRLKERLQSAIDATALAVARDGPDKNDAELTELANAYFVGHLSPQEVSAVGGLSVKRTKKTVQLAVAANSATNFVTVLGITAIPVGVKTEVLLENQTFEIALVLDNSGSMAGSKINALRNAASTLVDTLYGDVQSNPNLTFSLVPFSSAVNVGTQHKNAPWIDRDGVSPLHSLEFSAPANRFDLYDRIANVDWPGCVETRPYPMDVKDTPASPGNPETLFVPYFAPDEPDSGYYWNSYLPDGISGSDMAKRQKNVAKYAPGVSAGKPSIGTAYGRGPAFLCNSHPIRALTGNKNEIKAAISSMQALGGTNITEGLVWGWRTLSPDQPFTEGRPYGEEANTKIIILLTDGSNDWGDQPNHNKSYYGPYGYVAQGRLGITSGSKAMIVARMNDRLKEACGNVRTQGVRVYAITFGELDATTQNLMRDCATKPSLYFNAPSVAEIQATFEAIAADIRNLRIIK